MEIASVAMSTPVSDPGPPELQVRNYVTAMQTSQQLEGCEISKTTSVQQGNPMRATRQLIPGHQYDEGRRQPFGQQLRLWAARRHSRRISRPRFCTGQRITHDEIT